MKRLNAQKFVDELSDAPWDSAFEDTDDIVDSWYKFLLSFLILRYLWKRKEWKKRNQPNWITTEINEAMKKRDKLLKKARISESPVDWATFKRAKNEVCKLIRSAKEQYFKNNLLNINIILKDRGALSGI